MDALLSFGAPNTCGCFAQNAAAENAIAEAAFGLGSPGGGGAGVALDASGLETLRLRQEGAALRVQAVVRGRRARRHVQWVREVGPDRARARQAAKSRGDPYCRRLEGRSSYGKLRNDIAGMLVDALVEAGSTNAQYAGEWAVREVLGDAVAVAARRHAVGTEGQERRNSLEEMRRHQQEMEDRARRQRQLAEGQEQGEKGPGDTARFLSACVQPVLAKSLLTYDQEDPRPDEIAAALKRAIRNPEEEDAEPPAPEELVR